MSWFSFKGDSALCWIPLCQELKAAGLADLLARGPEILAAVKTPCPADTMCGNEIRMTGFKALAKDHFQEAIEAGIIFAKAQGGHSTESHTMEIMKRLVTYGSAAREPLPGLNELIVAP